MASSLQNTSSSLSLMIQNGLFPRNMQLSSTVVALRLIFLCYQKCCFSFMEWTLTLRNVFYNNLWRSILRKIWENLLINCFEGQINDRMDVLLYPYINMHLTECFNPIYFNKEIWTRQGAQWPSWSKTSNSSHCTYTKISSCWSLMWRQRASTPIYP